MTKQLTLNNNPLQFIPVALTECRYLQVLNISFTYVKILPIEICLLKQMYDLNLDGCPLAEPIAQVYPKGVLALMKHFEDKMEREKYREKISKQCKEDIWVDNTLDDILDKIGAILVQLESDDISLLKRLLRNLKYMVPADISDLDPSKVRELLLSSRAGSDGASHGQVTGQFNQSMSKSLHPKKVTQVEDQSLFLQASEQPQSVEGTDSNRKK
jgi:Leucine-rich repeat (LRR) protein